MRRPLTPDELVIESCLWALEGCRPATIARILGVAPQTVAVALKKSGGWYLVYPGAGRRKRQEFWFFPEADRERLGIPYSRCYMTGAERIYWGGVNCDRGNHPLTAWEKRVTG